MLPWCSGSRGGFALSSSSRRKGAAAEVEVVHALERAGYRAITSRNARGGSQQGEDVITDFPAVVEVKNQQRLDLAGWWSQAERQAQDGIPLVVHKRRGFSRAEEWWATMTLEQLFRLVEDVRRDAIGDQGPNGTG